MSNDKKKSTILIVEDSLTTRKLQRMILERERYIVLEAENGRAALDVMQDEQIDCVVTDVVMPEMGGMELLKAIRSSPLTMNIPVIVCTSVSGQDYVRKALALGTCGYLLKPIVARDLLQQVVKAERLVIPVLENPHRTRYTLGLQTHEFQTLVQVMVDDARARLNKIEPNLVRGDCAEFDKFSRDLSGSAANFGARALQTAAADASRGIMTAELNERGTYLLSLHTQMQRLREAVLSL